MKILVIGNDSAVLSTLNEGLKEEEPAVIAAGDGETGLRAFRQQQPDVIVLDSEVRVRDGFEVLQEIRQVSDVPVIMLSSRQNEADQVWALELGADDYLIRPFGHLALIARVRALLRRARASAMARRTPNFVYGELAINFHSRQVTRRGKLVRLTPVEYKLLVHLVHNSGRLMSHEALLCRLPGESSITSTDHLKVFMRRLRSKIERRGGPRLIEIRRGFGYRFVGVDQAGDGARKAGGLVSVGVRAV